MKLKYFILILIPFLFSCENDIKAIQELGERKIGVEEGKNIDSYLSKGGKVSARLTSPVMLRYLTDTPRIEFPKSLFVTFYSDSTGKVESTLFAKYSRYNESERLVLLRDSVVVNNLKMGNILRTEELWWDQNKEILYSHVPVRIRQSFGDTLRGNYGMEAKQDFSRYTMFGVRGEIPIADSTLPPRQ